MILGIVVAVAILAGVIGMVLSDNWTAREPTFRIGRKAEYVSELRHRRTETLFWWTSTVISGVGVVGALIAAFYAAQAFEEGKKQTRAMLDEQRPWIKVDMEPGRIVWKDSAKKMPDGRIVSTPAYGMVHYDMTSKNIGKSPAFDVKVLLHPYVLNATTVDISAEMVKYQEEVCDRAQNTFEGTAIDTLFPDQSAEEKSWVGILADRAGDVGTRQGRFTHVLITEKSMSVYLIGCLTYRYASSDILHKTPFLFGVEKKDAGDNSDPDLDKNYDKDQLTYTRIDFGKEYPLNRAD